MAASVRLAMMRQPASRQTKSAMASVRPGSSTQASSERQLSLGIHDFAPACFHHTATAVVQPKLFIGAASDRFEREADKAADQVMQYAEKDPLSSSPQVATVRLSCGCDSAGRETIQRQIESPFDFEDGLLDKEEGQPADSPALVQAVPISAGRPAHVAGVSAAIQALHSNGKALPSRLRSFMEPRFGHDFGRVRVHTGYRASSLAKGINARAFVVGRDIVFGEGQFAPETEPGRWLIAHELAHVVQQGQAVRPLASPTVAGYPPRLAHDAQMKVIRRVKWNPNTDTGKRSAPWGPSGPTGRILKAATDGNKALKIWRPDDNVTYWCHGFTFGGSVAKGGPYSIWGKDVPAVLHDDGWQQTQSCMAIKSNIMVFRDAKGLVRHSGIIRNVVSNAGVVDETRSTIESKWGAGSLNTKSWRENARNYGSYSCYSKSPLVGACGKGAHES